MIILRVCRLAIHCPLDPLEKAYLYQKGYTQDAGSWQINSQHDFVVKSAIYNLVGGFFTNPFKKICDFFIISPNICFFFQKKCSKLRCFTTTDPVILSKGGVDPRWSKTMALCTMPLPTRLTVPHPSLDSVEVVLVPLRYCQRLQA